VGGGSRALRGKGALQKAEPVAAQDARAGIGRGQGTQLVKVSAPCDAPGRFQPAEATIKVAANAHMVPADEVGHVGGVAADIGQRKWAYPQTAVVAAFDHERHHGFTSTEFHTQEGPFTQVPLPGNRSSLVWVMRPERVEEVMAMAPDALALEIERNLQSTLGKISGVTTPQAWPLSSLVANTFGKARVMLIGQAAHAFPPIGAQGLNLGFRDVADLAAVLSKAGNDPGAPSVARRYDMRRRADVYMRTGGVDLLNRSLLTDFLPVQMGRAAFLSVLRNIAPLRGLVMREGIEPGGGLKAIAEGFRRVPSPVRTDRPAG